MNGFWLFTCWVLAIACAWLLRNRVYAVFSGLFLGVVCLVWAALFPIAAPGLQPLFVGLQIATILHFVLLSRPRLRPLAYRLLISLPGLWFMAGSLLAIPWALFAAFGFYPHAWWLPYLLSLIGVWQSLRNPGGEVDILIDRQHAGDLSRHDQQLCANGRVLRICQITDPHLGPFMSVARLRTICEDAVAMEPDLVLITGDLLTMESQMDTAAVVAALAPLRAMEGRVFACLGNHDHEARDTVYAALAQIGGRLLVDEMQVAETPLGPVELVGAEFVYRKRREHLHGLFAGLPPRGAMPRILLLHDPGAFRHVPDGAADLTLSGHTHGGHLGLLSLGINWTVIGAASTVPDHGLWSQGRNRLYVHRGTGHYGFPIRLGVPGEESLLRVWFS